MMQPIVLTGFMSSGKSTVAKALGDKWRCVVVDLDEVIASAEGRASWEIIEQDGEESFRAIETRVLREVLAAASTRVIALGGGAWIRPENRDLVNNHNGVSVWLDAPFELCWSRISDGEGRRPLAVDQEQSNTLYDRRKQHYSLAHVRIAVDASSTVEEIVEAIVRALDSDFVGKHRL